MAVVDNRVKIALAAAGVLAVVAVPTLIWQATAHPTPASHQVAAVTAVASGLGTEEASAVPSTPTTDAATVASTEAPGQQPATQNTKAAAKPNTQRTNAAAAQPADDPTDEPTETPDPSPKPSLQRPNLYIPAGNFDGHSWPSLYCKSPDGPPCYDSPFADGKEYVFHNSNGDVDPPYTRNASGYWVPAEG